MSAQRTLLHFRQFHQNCNGLAEFEQSPKVERAILRPAARRARPQSAGCEAHSAFIFYFLLDHLFEVAAICGLLLAVK